jgi:hypothetical protein
LSRIVDGQTEASSIAQLFAAKYRDLFSNVPYTTDKMRSVEDIVEALLADSSFYKDCVINDEDVRNAVSRLKAHKNASSSELSSDYVINAGNDCMVHFALLFSSVIVLGTAPTNFLSSTFVPIPKGRNVSENFRGIALKYSVKYSTI